MKDNPCDRNCPERSSTCHATCEKYEAFFNKRQELLKKKNKAKNDRYILDWRK